MAKTTKKKTAEEESSATMNQGVPFVPATENTTHEEKPKYEDPVAQDAKERARLGEVQMKALDDKKVRELQEKADNANDEEQIKASKAYYKAMYEKMRELDGSLKNRIDRMEAATLKRLNEKKIGGGQSQ